MSIRKQGLKVFFAAVTCLSLAAMAMADDEGGKGKGKGKGKPDAAPAASPTIIQLDVSKLPPDLVKALTKYAAPAGKGAKAAEAPSKGKAPAGKAPAAKAAQAPSKGKAPAPAAKGKAPAQAAKGYAGGKQLPPGLAKKPANHPGRTHYIEHVLGGKVTGPTGKGAPGKPAAPAKPGKGKKSQEEEE